MYKRRGADSGLPSVPDCLLSRSLLSRSLLYRSKMCHYRPATQTSNHSANQLHHNSTPVPFSTTYPTPTPPLDLSSSYQQPIELVDLSSSWQQTQQPIELVDLSSSYQQTQQAIELVDLPTSYLQTQQPIELVLGGYDPAEWTPVTDVPPLSLHLPQEDLSKRFLEIERQNKALIQVRI